MLDSGWSEEVNRAADWLKQAESDLQVAKVYATRGYHEGAAFASQQCAEKAVIAVHESLGRRARGHSIETLLAQLPAPIAVPGRLTEVAKELSRVYLSSRYPDEFPSGTPHDHFTEETSRAFMNHAREVLEFCRSQIH